MCLAQQVSPSHANKPTLSYLSCDMSSPMGIGVEREGHQRELEKRNSTDSDESTLPVGGDPSPKSVDGNDNGDVGAHGEEQPGTQSGADTLADMYDTLEGPPARKRARRDLLEVDTTTKGNASKESIVKMKVPS